MSKTEKIKQVIKDAFDGANYGGVGAIYVSDDETRASFEVYPDDVTFERLEKIANGLNTKMINVEGVSEGGGGCDTCGYGGSSSTVELKIDSIPD